MMTSSFFITMMKGKIHRALDKSSLRGICGGKKMRFLVVMVAIFAMQVAIAEEKMLTATNKLKEIGIDCANPVGNEQKGLCLMLNSEPETSNAAWKIRIEKIDDNMALIMHNGWTVYAANPYEDIVSDGIITFYVHNMKENTTVAPSYCKKILTTKTPGKPDIVEDYYLVGEKINANQKITLNCNFMFSFNSQGFETDFLEFDQPTKTLREISENNDKVLYVQFAQHSPDADDKEESWYEINKIEAYKFADAEGFLQAVESYEKSIGASFSQGYLGGDK